MALSKLWLAKTMWRVPKPSLIPEWANTGGFLSWRCYSVPVCRREFTSEVKRGGLAYLARRAISGITSPTARFNGGFNTGVRGGYWEPWRFEEEYSYRPNGARDVVGSNFAVNAAGGTGTAIRL